MSQSVELAGYDQVLADIVGVLDQARAAAIRNVNTIMTATYWAIGQRIVEQEQSGEQRANYGETLVNRLATDLTDQFGRGFSRPNLQRMRQFYLMWPPSQIAQTLSAKSDSGLVPGDQICSTVSSKSSYPALLIHLSDADTEE